MINAAGWVGIGLLWVFVVAPAAALLLGAVFALGKRHPKPPGR